MKACLSLDQGTTAYLEGSHLQGNECAYVSTYSVDLSFAWLRLARSSQYTAGTTGRKYNKETVSFISNNLLLNFIIHAVNVKSYISVNKYKKN